MRPESVGRRTVIAGALAGLAAITLGGCQGARWYPSSVSPDEYLLRRVVSEKETMVARYRAAISAGTGPGGLLERLLADHEEHLAELRSRLPQRSAEENEENEVTASSAPVSEDEATDPAVLRVAEEAAAAARARQAAGLADSSLAQLLSSVGACEAGHAHLLAMEVR
ncbi:hypothetical protein ACQEU5_03215 [Marinactinospora thermotolerans]|uniref:Ferritin-like domain-containing protein n=1 Tax=Marinactinospora thermotolerans DSM 45154 TaxID=1122192 RepID=A0A1T4LG85_9ACTN|nr:hypothetical protein [Marinactinospora thermotolerans]SJZ53739.1 hypothetical protein SAMN02745673_00665 [Marinactinospora thermotolerans DSM 45154]